MIYGAEMFILNKSERSSIVNISHRLVGDRKWLLGDFVAQIGSYVGEDDIVRFEDRYGRC